MISFILMSAFCAFLDYYSLAEITNVYLFSIGWGTVLSWSAKSGFLVSLHTGNFLKICEHGVKSLAGYHLGDEKQLGDIFSLICLVFSFGLGCAFGIMVDPRLQFYVQLLLVMTISSCLITVEFAMKHIPDMYRAYKTSKQQENRETDLSSLELSEIVPA